MKWITDLKGSFHSSNSGNLEKVNINVKIFIHFELSCQSNNSMNMLMKVWLNETLCLIIELLLPLPIYNVGLILLIKVFEDFPNICVLLLNPKI